MAEISTSKKQLGQWLVDRGAITADQLRNALEEQRKTGLYLREVLYRLGIAPDDEIIKYFEEELMIPVVRISDYDVDDSIIRLVPEKLARRYRMLPLFQIRNTLTLAMEDPLNVLAIDEVSAETGCDIEPCVATRHDIGMGLGRYYGAESRLDIFDGELADDGVASMEIERHVIEFVERMVAQSIEDGASDIHIEPDHDGMHIRFRVDGLLREVTKQPLAVHAAIVSRIKVQSDLDIAERRLPQDGRFQMTLPDRQIDVRVSTFPTVHGENVVLRLLDKKNAMLTLNELGFDRMEREKMESLIAKPNGMLLVTGPTGSGKTTTLYAILQTINTPERNIQTLEDPVEYLLAGIRQTQVNEEIGLTFACGLRALVRQDPDVILVGEIRDRESAEIGIRSSLTGHLVMSTLHTNDAVGALARLMDMEVDPFLLASSLLGIIAQRLVRRICKHCKIEVEVPAHAGATLGYRFEASDRFSEGSGCPQCKGTGYRGRVAIYEIIEITRGIRTALMDGQTLENVREIARADGSRSLRDAAIRKALDGMTTLEEVLRVTKLDAEAKEIESPQLTTV